MEPPSWLFFDRQPPAYWLRRHANGALISALLLCSVYCIIALLVVVATLLALPKRSLAVTPQDYCAIPLNVERQIAPPMYFGLKVLCCSPTHHLPT